jgi:ABC-2 type transport system ATP-binding protein
MSRIATPPAPPGAPPLADSSPPAIGVRDLAIRYGRATVLAEISLAVEPGSVYALLGRNGEGKTSLVRCLLGLQRPHTGSVELFGTAVWEQRARLLSRVGVVPETPDAPPGLTARELAAFVAALYPRFDHPFYSGQLARFGVPAELPFARLSRGQKTQVQLALALAPRPELLVLDDPTLGLDAVARRAVIDQLVIELADRGTTMLLTTHDLTGAERLATHVGVLAGGRLRVNEELDALRARVRRLTWPGASAPAGFLPADVVTRLEVGAADHGAFGHSAIAWRWDGEALPRLADPTGTLPRVEPLDLEALFACLTAPGTDAAAQADRETALPGWRPPAPTPLSPPATPSPAAARASVETP